VSDRSGVVELIDAINTLARRPGRVRPFHLTGLYFNINTIDDYNYAQYAVREKRFKDYTISVVIPAHNEAESIEDVVRDFVDKVDEVMVVNNRSNDATGSIARNAGATVRDVKLEGYGDTIRHGLEHAAGDIMVIVEGDYSFRARDLGKMLEYLKDADMVVGTRTTQEMVEQATNMRGIVRWANVFVAKAVELMWWSQQPRFTDVGCTYRALWKDTYTAIRPHLRGTGPELSPEMMIAVLQTGKRVIEIPISYHQRSGGSSKHSANYAALTRTAFRMIRTIVRKRIECLFANGRTKP
jgi:glycosyltransferase involved in cell wall biosynthesis